jgi:hypothetical protein
MIRRVQAPVLACRDATEPRSEKLLRVFGFSFLGIDPDEGEIWQWTNAPYRREETDPC